MPCGLASWDSAAVGSGGDDSERRLSEASLAGSVHQSLNRLRLEGGIAREVGVTEGVVFSGTKPE